MYPLEAMTSVNQLLNHVGAAQDASWVLGGFVNLDDANARRIGDIKMLLSKAYQLTALIGGNIAENTIREVTEVE